MSKVLLVEDSMTQEVVTREPDTTAAEALWICRERRMRHLPVLENWWLVGIVSKRDLRSAIPDLGASESATALT